MPYEMMPTKDIIALAPKIEEIADEDSFLFMWVTNNSLADGLKVMEAWGYQYKTNLVWIKDKYGLGFYFRAQHEICLLGVKGRPRYSTREGRWGTDVPSVLFADRSEHSRKPEAFYEIVEAFGSTYCELFARRERKGWTSIGDELGTVL